MAARDCGRRAVDSIAPLPFFRARSRPRVRKASIETGAKFLDSFSQDILPRPTFQRSANRGCVVPPGLEVRIFASQSPA